MGHGRKGVDGRFIMVFQGLHEHLPHIDHKALKVYLNLLFHVYSHERTRGEHTTTNKQLSKETGLSPDTVKRALDSLQYESKSDEHGQLFGPYIEVENHGKSKTITVLRYDNPFRRSSAWSKAKRKQGDVGSLNSDVEASDSEFADVPFD